MTEQINGYETYEEIYLTVIHNANDIDKIDLHTYFYWKNLECCPICNEWLVERSLPHATE